MIIMFSSVIYDVIILHLHLVIIIIIICISDIVFNESDPYLFREALSKAQMSVQSHSRSCANHQWHHCAKIIAGASKVERPMLLQ